MSVLLNVSEAEAAYLRALLEPREAAGDSVASDILEELFEAERYSTPDEDDDDDDEEAEGE
jgi:hypothetical protein